MNNLQTIEDAQHKRVIADGWFFETVSTEPIPAFGGFGSGNIVTERYIKGDWRLERRYYRDTCGTGKPRKGNGIANNKFKDGAEQWRLKAYLPSVSIDNSIVEWIECGNTYADVLEVANVAKETLEQLGRKDVVVNDTAIDLQTFDVNDTAVDLQTFDVNDRVEPLYDERYEDVIKYGWELVCAVAKNVASTSVFNPGREVTEIYIQGDFTLERKYYQNLPGKGRDRNVIGLIDVDFPDDDEVWQFIADDCIKDEDRLPLHFERKFAGVEYKKVLSFLHNLRGFPDVLAIKAKVDACRRRKVDKEDANDGTPPKCDENYEYATNNGWRLQAICAKQIAITESSNAVKMITETYHLGDWTLKRRYYQYLSVADNTCDRNVKADSDFTDNEEWELYVEDYRVTPPKKYSRKAVGDKYKELMREALWMNDFPYLEGQKRYQVPHPLESGLLY